MRAVSQRWIAVRPRSYWAWAALGLVGALAIALLNLADPGRPPWALGIAWAALIASLVATTAIATRRRRAQPPTD
jgi:membrane protein YdbS with pleckstrin-like domain